jgi:hypothetical protein
LGALVDLVGGTDPAEIERPGVVHPPHPDGVDPGVGARLPRGRHEAHGAVETGRGASMDWFPAAADHGDDLVDHAGMVRERRRGAGWLGPLTRR